MFDTVVRCGDELAEVVAALDPDRLAGPAAREWWAAFQRIDRLASAGMTLLARRVAATHRPAQRGTKTAAEDLARRAGTTTGAAKDAVNTSQLLPEQPAVDQALRRGELSPAQVALISSAAAANPAEEQRLVESAPRVSLAELREECARVRAAADPDPAATNRRLHAARQLRRWIDGEGFWILHAKGTPQAGAAFNAAIQPISDQLFNDARADGRREPVEAYAFDALIHLAEHATGRCSCHLTADRSGESVEAEQPDPSTPETDDVGKTDSEAATTPAGGSPTVGDDSAIPPPGAVLPGSAGDEGDIQPSSLLLPGSPGSGQPGIFAARPEAAPPCAVRPRQTVNPRYLALLRVDLQALRRGRVDGDELCEITGVGPVPVTVARELLGEAILKLVITDGVDVLNVTHLGRGPTAAQKAALLWMNPTCSVQGCYRTRTENDHRKPWAQTRHTRLDELDPLCEFHHDLKTRCGYALIPGSGKRAFVPPDDPRHPNNHKASPTRPTGRAGPTDTGGPPASERPSRRPDRKHDPGPTANASSGRRLRARQRTRAAGRQPDLFAVPQPP